VDGARRGPTRAIRVPSPVISRAFGVLLRADHEMVPRIIILRRSFIIGRIHGNRGELGSVDWRWRVTWANSRVPRVIRDCAGEIQVCIEDPDNYSAGRAVSTKRALLRC